MTNIEAASEQPKASEFGAEVVRPAALAGTYACIVANRTGGQGKTVVTQLLYEALREGGVPAKLASVDTDARSAERSKLGGLYPETKDLPISADLADVAEEDPSVALRHWDAFGALLRERNTVIDLGANVIGSMLRWAQMSLQASAMRGKPLNFLVVVTAQEKSAADAIAVLNEIEATRGALEIGKIGVVFNEGLGKFERAGPNLTALRALIAEKGYAAIEISRGMIKAVDAGVSIGRLRTIEPADYQKAMELEFDTAANRELWLAQAWIKKSIEAIRAAGFAPAAG